MAHRAYRLSMLAAVAALVSGAVPACGSGGPSAGPQTRTVQVDFRHDEFETAMLEYYPKRLTIRQGDTVEFEQAWTGEPHSVTFGTLFEPSLREVDALLSRVKETGKLPDEPPEVFETFDFPGAFTGDEATTASQNAARPCYVEEATEYPGDADTPCPQVPQPAFTGRHAVYSSGLIPYEGVGGNSFSMTIADDATPGTYSYYCNVHFILQYGQITVAEKGSEIPSASAVAKQARRQATAGTEVLLATWKAAKAGRPIRYGEPGGEQTMPTKGLRLAGVPSVSFDEDMNFVHGSIQEFVPRDFSVRAGEKVTWTFSSGHTVSFNVPSYFPIFTVDADGTVRYNTKAAEPAGWPGPPEPKGGPPEEDGPPGGGEPVEVDAGPWDGSGFRSTGLDYPSGSRFSVTFTKPGTYPYACLIHPKMVGTLKVT